MSEEKNQQTEYFRTFCPFRQVCSGPNCQLWSLSEPFYAARMENLNEKGEYIGMCSIRLLAEAVAFISRGNDLIV